MQTIQRSLDMSMIYISHDMAVIAEVCDVVGVMYAGKLVEFGPTVDVYARPIHPIPAHSCLPSRVLEVRSTNWSACWRTPEPCWTHPADAPSIRGARTRLMNAEPPHRR